MAGSQRKPMSSNQEAVPGVLVIPLFHLFKEKLGISLGLLETREDIVFVLSFQIFFTIFSFLSVLFSFVKETSVVNSCVDLLCSCSCLFHLYAVFALLCATNKPK